MRGWFGLYVSFLASGRINLTFSIGRSDSSKLAVADIFFTIGGTILFDLSSANRVKNFGEMTVSTFIMNKKILLLMMTRLEARF